MRFLATLTAATALAMLAGVASAHPKLVSATPAADATVVKPAHVDLTFSEKLMPAFSKGDVTMAAMPGMAAMKLVSASALSADGHTLIITPKAPLSSGHYSVSWHVVSTDTHKVDGTYAFAVK